MSLLLWLGSQLSSCWSNMSILGVFLTVFALLFDFMKRRKKWKHYPPGPMSLPFIGTMLHVDFCNPHLSFKQVSAGPLSRTLLTHHGPKQGWGCPGTIYPCTKLKGSPSPKSRMTLLPKDTAWPLQIKR